MEVSLEEIEKNELNTENLDIAVRTLNEVGYVILEKILPINLMKRIRSSLEERNNQNDEAVTLMSVPFLDPRIIDNPLAMQIIEAAMGNKFFSSLPYGFNTTVRDALYGTVDGGESDTQWIHRDAGQLFPGFPIVLPISKIVVNIPLVDFTAENGCTELWPGSHLIVDPPIDVNDPYHAYHICSEERAATLPSIRLVMPAGSVVVRDMRCWHRAMPNHTDKTRTMIAIVYLRQFHNTMGDHGVFRSGIPEEMWEQMSDRVRSVYRFHPVIK